VCYALWSNVDFLPDYSANVDLMPVYLTNVVLVTSSSILCIV